MVPTPRSKRGGWCRRWRPPDGRRQKAEDGFTLIELLIVLLILPIVIGGVTVAIITSLQDQQNLAGQLENSSGAQGASAFFVRDVQSATTITVPSSTSCGISRGTQLLVLQWNNSAVTVSYEYNTSGTKPALVRSFCAAGSESDTYLSLDLDPAHPPTVTVSVCPNGGPCQQETSGTWTAGSATSPIDTVELTATYAGSGSVFSVTATPRQWSPPPGGSPVSPLLVLGAGRAALSDSATGNVLVNGPLTMDSSVNGSITMTPSETGNLSTSNGNPIYVANLNPSKAVRNRGSGIVNPQPSYSPSTPDPFGGVNSPSKPAPPTQPLCVDDSMTDIETCSPGLYTSALPAPAAGHAVSFESGVYYLTSGMDLSNAGSVTDTSNPSDPSSSGVLFYVTAGGVSFPSANTVSLTSLASSSQFPNPQNLIVWQASSAPGDSVTLTSAGAGSSYAGAVYAPNGQVMFSDSGPLAVTRVIAQSAHFAQSGSVTIG